jgi:hypothetical protein
MKIEKAIGVLKYMLNYIKPPKMTRQHDAIKLGIEALNRVQEGRQAHPEFSRLLLPGETQK